MGTKGKKVIGFIMGSINLKSDIPMHSKLYLDGSMYLDDLVYKTVHIDQVEDPYQILGRAKSLRVRSLLLSDFLLK